MPSRSRGISSGAPITPVDISRTASRAISSSSATSFAHSTASVRPGCPVPALACPELIITARIFSRLRDRIAWLKKTGAAFVRLVVKSAAALHGCSE
jgi:hypothetical protein